MLRAWHLSFIFLMVIFFWPTYLFGVGYDFGQKAYYFVCALFAVVLAMVAGAGRISINGLALVSPLIFLFASVFILRLPVASIFEVGILIKLTLLFTVLHSAYLFIKPSLEFGKAKAAMCARQADTASSVTVKSVSSPQSPGKAIPLNPKSSAA